MSAAPANNGGRFLPGQSGNPAGGKPGLMRRRVAALLADCGATPGELDALTQAAGDPIVSAAMMSIMLRRLRELPALTGDGQSDQAAGGAS